MVWKNNHFCPKVLSLCPQYLTRICSRICPFFIHCIKDLVWGQFKIYNLIHTTNLLTHKCLHIELEIRLTLVIWPIFDLSSGTDSIYCTVFQIQDSEYDQPTKCIHCSSGIIHLFTKFHLHPFTPFERYPANKQIIQKSINEHPQT